ncbi:MAG: hypothetical protein HGA85_09345 [Nanoarchaeota archaeon]|nr:hypothetical protein [Nanoarchaeota archaeon]
MRKDALIRSVFLAVVLLSSAFAAVVETDAAIEQDKIITFASAILATFLFVTCAVAYHRNKHKRLLFVTIAFLIYAIKGFLVSSELFIPEMEWVDPVSSYLDFAILLSFFAGIMKK